MSTLNALPFPIDANSVPYYDNADTNGYLTMPIEQYIRNGSNLFVPVSTANPQPTSDAGVLAKQNEILTKLTALETKLNRTLDVQLSGSIPEYGWLSTDDEPTPDDPTKMAFGIVIDVSTDTMSTKYWNGSLWKELI